MRWIRSQVISSMMFQIVPLPVLAAGTAMQPPAIVQVAPLAQHRSLGPVGASQKTNQVVNLSSGQTRPVVARH
jgi:hypothetical protein